MAWQRHSLLASLVRAPFVPRIGVRGRPQTFPPRSGETVLTHSLKRGWMGNGMNPLRLASLDASPFCGAKGGGIGLEPEAGEDLVADLVDGGVVVGLNFGAEVGV